MIYSKLFAPSTEVMAVVKADAYGHGAVEVCRKLMAIGVELFAVSNIDEAIELRKKDITGEILVLGYTSIECVDELYRYGITQTLLSEEYAEKIKNAGLDIKCQFAIDTGMNRIGLNAADENTCEEIIRKYADELNLNGIFTHLCVADSDSFENKEYTQKQVSLFETVAERVSDLKLRYIHCMNSAGGLFCKLPKITNCIRLGIIMYGLKPDTSNILPDGIEPVLSWKSVVSMVKQISCGESIGYGRTFFAEKTMWIATIPTGYADGYRRDLSNKGYVLLHGYKAPIVGRICMDQMMVDVTVIKEAGQDVNVGDEVVLIGKSGEYQITADDMGEMIGTIGYEIVCGISKRVPRKY